MNATISKRVRSILSDPKSARELMKQSMRVQRSEESGPIKIGEETFYIQRVGVFGEENTKEKR